MYLKLTDESGNARIINTDAIIEARYSPAHEVEGEYPGEDTWTAPARVRIKTTGTGYEEAGSEDYGTWVALRAPYEIELTGEDAERFMESLPTYEPLLDRDL